MFFLEGDELTDGNILGGSVIDISQPASTRASWMRPGLGGGL
jgi:hypothetical protein